MISGALQCQWDLTGCQGRLREFQGISEASGYFKAVSGMFQRVSLSSRSVSGGLRECQGPFPGGFRGVLESFKELKRIPGAFHRVFQEFRGVSESFQGIPKAPRGLPGDFRCVLGISEVFRSTKGGFGGASRG